MADEDNSQRAEPVASNANGDTGKRRRSHQGSGEGSRKDRESAHSAASPRRLLRLLVEEEYQTSQLRKLLASAFDRIESESGRALEAERLAEETSKRLIDVETSSKEEAVRTAQQLSLANRDLENAQQEVAALRTKLRAAEGRRDEAEAATAKARSMARKLGEQRLVEVAKEQGRRLGFEAGFVRGQRRGFEDARATTNPREQGLPKRRVPPIVRPPTHREATFDAGSDRAASLNEVPFQSLPMDSPVAVRRPEVLQTNFTGSNLVEDDTSTVPPEAEDVFMVGGDEPVDDLLFQQEPLPTSPLLSAARTPLVQVFEVDIPSQGELEGQPPPSPHTPTIPLPAIHPETDIYVHDDTQPGRPVRSLSGRFTSLARRLTHQRQGSGDVPSSHSRVPSMNHDGHAVVDGQTNMSEPIASEHQPAESGPGITRSLSKLMKRIAGAVDRASGSRHWDARAHQDAIYVNDRGSRRASRISVRRGATPFASPHSSRRSIVNHADSTPSSLDSPPEITIVPPSRPSSESTGQHEFAFSSMLSSDHSAGHHLPVIPDAQLYSSDEPSSPHQVQRPDFVEPVLPSHPPEFWLPPGFVPDRPAAPFPAGHEGAIVNSPISPR